MIAFFVRAGSLPAAIVGGLLYFLDTLGFMFLGHFSYIRLVILVVLGEAILATNQLRKQGKLMQQHPADQFRAA